MENLLVKKFTNKDDLMILASFTEDGLISNNNDEPAITLYNEDKKEIAHIYVENGRINDYEDKPAISLYKNESTININVLDGIIHNENNPAIIFNKNETKYQYFFNKGYIENINGASVIKENSTNSIELFTQKNKTYSGYCCHIKNDNILEKKARVLLHFKTETKLDLDNVSDIFDNIYDMVTSLNKESETYDYPEDDSKLPHLISLKKNIIEKVMWLNSEGLHRIEKPALIEYLNKSKVKFYYYENGKQKETLFIPHTFTQSRRGMFKILDFSFLNEEVQDYYEVKKLTPFFVNLKEIDNIEKLFSNF